MVSYMLLYLKIYLIFFFSCRISNPISKHKAYEPVLIKKKFLDDLRSARFKIEKYHNIKLQKKKNYKIIKVNQCNNTVNNYIAINKKKFLKVYSLVCYVGSSKKKANEKIKQIYKVIGDKIKKIGIKRDYLNNYYRVSLGPFISYIEAIALKNLFRNAIITQIEISNNPKNIKDIFFNDKLKLLNSGRNFE